MRADGWAVTENGTLKIRTVSDTRRAAIVNFLCTERHVLVLDDATDRQIEDKWQELRGKAEVLAVTVAATLN